MKISGVDIRPGNNIEYEGGLWRAVKIQHTQPGKGGAYMQVELKNLIDGRKNNVRFRSAESVERIRLDTRISSISIPRATCSSSWTPRPTTRSTCRPISSGDAAAFLADGMNGPARNV